VDKFKELKDSGQSTIEVFKELEKSINDTTK
jgi:hypothetical protein